MKQFGKFVFSIPHFSTPRTLPLSLSAPLTPPSVLEALLLLPSSPSENYEIRVTLDDGGGEKVRDWTTMYVKEAF